MSKTHKDVMKYFDKNEVKKRRGEASARFKAERKRKDDTRLFKRELNFTTWLEQTADKD
jgi:hypothetical protein